MPQYPDKTQRGIILKRDHQLRSIGGKSWFFGIGINDYAEFPPLNNAVKDVKNLISLLQGQYGFLAEHTLTLFDGEATRKNIISTLDRLELDVGPADKLIIYYSGHGHLNKHNKKGYWIPTNAEQNNSSEYIRNSTVREAIENIKSLHTLLISDSCFSGSLLVRGNSRSTTAIQELESRRSRWVICSGRHDEEVYDGNPGGNSPFAKSILDTLKHGAQKEITVYDLVGRVVHQTRANYKQTPEGCVLFGVGDEGGQYIFRRQTNESDDWAAAKSGTAILAFQQYLENHPDGLHADEAREQLALLEEDAAWQEANFNKTKKDYIRYRRNYPNGRYRYQALEAIRLLEEEESWQQARRRQTLFDYEQYREKYPDGKYRKEVETAIDAILQRQSPAQQTAKEKNQPESQKQELKKRHSARKIGESFRTPPATDSKPQKAGVTSSGAPKKKRRPFILLMFLLLVAAIVTALLWWEPLQPYLLWNNSTAGTFDSLEETLNPNPGFNAEQAAFKAARTPSTIPSLRRFLAQYSNGPYADSARIEMAKIDSAIHNRLATAAALLDGELKDDALESLKVAQSFDPTDQLIKNAIRDVERGNLSRAIDQVKAALSNLDQN